MENLIRILRKENKLSQEDLAKLCHILRQTINVIENNKYEPILEFAFKLAKSLGVTVEQLFIYKN
ncbi:helix-turn-helix transcriptional regulator [Bacillus cereus]|uniref:Helix-turn-helix transcriptional regulator n=1 Tax=Bacillus cereus TaxID=1396 RepID=A0AB73UBG9_BACCE|nr:helix-turn-helix transcriptional regulator [Bacillus cereus]QHV03729.1 transcriptional regulator [Bacillus cereus]QHV41710.1 helix-turn-helix transcriptional regulator [Bacillus cereus]